MILGLIVVPVFMLTIFTLWLRLGQRQARDVIYDLQEEKEQKETLLETTFSLTLKDKGKLSRKRQDYLVILLFVTSIVVLRVLIFPVTISGVLISGVGGLGIGYIFAQSLHRKKDGQFKRDIEFFLPLVMERLVMTVGAGLDILPAIQRVVELDKEGGEINSHNHAPIILIDKDPVTRLLEMVHNLTEGGLGFSQSLRKVTSLVDSPALRHAFLHLAVAHEEGGELIGPLRELSDATQLFYQETVEEEIAKMPVKATLPLLCTFAGLLLCFMTSPVMQVMSMAKKAVIPQERIGE